MKRNELLNRLSNLVPEALRQQRWSMNAPLQFASSGGGGGYDDGDDDYYDEVADESGPERQRTTEYRPTAARQRTVSSDNDDRYWTDYLRIALPVIGLLLVIAVFWFWAQQLIDNDSNDVSPTEPGLAEVVETAPDAATQAPESTEPATGDEQQPGSLLPASTPDQAQQQQPQPTQTPEAPAEQADAGAGEDPAPAAEIAPNTTVVVTEEGQGLRMRSEPSTADEVEVIVELDSGASLDVLSGPEEVEDFVWWEVVDDAGNQGWVVQEFIEPASQ